MTQSNQQIKHHKERNIFFVLLFIAVVTGVLALLIGGFSDRTTLTTSGNIDVSIDALVCSSVSKSSESIFDLSGANRADQRLNITFKNDEMDAIMYSLDAEYASEDTARAKEAELHAEYSAYIAKYNINAENISETFAYYDNSAKVSLYANRAALNRQTAQVFLLDSDNYTIEQLKAHYADKGFACNYKN